jgi:hypothetical protein
VAGALYDLAGMGVADLDEVVCEVAVHLLAPSFPLVRRGFSALAWCPGERWASGGGQVRTGRYGAGCGRQRARPAAGAPASSAGAVQAAVAGPVSPDHERIAVEILEIVALGPQHEQRRPEAVSSSSVGFLVPPVNGKTGPVVLKHRPDHVGISGGRPPSV